MSLSASEKLTLSEITGEAYEKVEEKLAAVDSGVLGDLEAKLGDKIQIWEDNAESVDLIIHGGSDGVDLKTQRLLDAVTATVRLWLGFDSGVRVSNRSTSVCTRAVW